MNGTNKSLAWVAMVVWHIVQGWAYQITPGMPRFPFERNINDGQGRSFEQGDDFDQGNLDGFQNLQIQDQRSGFLPGPNMLLSLPPRGPPSSGFAPWDAPPSCFAPYGSPPPGFAPWGSPPLYAMGRYGPRGNPWLPLFGLANPQNNGYFDQTASSSFNNPNEADVTYQQEDDQRYVRKAKTTKPECTSKNRKSQDTYNCQRMKKIRIV